ncbi:hypothetical protein [Aureibaculum luteum]|uniref:hypothetical protein n=1 Tax=Aureibaculum luteum TaxID=1548456 RepID=UPI000E4E43B5|nr:hypothetical protein [Aureibaculum luteum]
MKIKKGLKYVFLLGIIGLLFYVSLSFIYGGFDLRGTINTKYHNIENSTDKIIETNNFSLRAPKYWVHIFGGFGTEGDPYGTFQTPNGIIYYEYGYWAPSYEENNEIYNYTVEKQIINRFQINIARNDKNEVGICIPMQNEMKSSLTFYMDKSVTDNYDDLIAGIKEIKFK